ncbi:hypothetical protein thsrh120_51630 [Rhizobium sp. No.120]
MSIISTELGRRKFITTSLIGAATLSLPRIATATGITIPENSTVRPFKIAIPEAALAHMNQRIKATRWPEPETVGDTSQGLKLATMKAVADYWANEYNWHKAEDYLNNLPNFITEIDGVDIHFIHVKSKHPNALPMIITHGWPGSIFEQLKVIGPLTDPTRHGGTQADAFDLVIPSLPGHGFSGKPTELGWGHRAIGTAQACQPGRYPHEHASNGSGRYRQSARFRRWRACRPFAG